MTIKIQGDKITFPDDSEQTTAYTGSSGSGGDAQPPVVFRAKQTNTQPIPDGVETKILFDITEFDSDSYFDTSNNRYIPKKEGYYQFNCNIQLGGTVTGQSFMGSIKKNGASVAVGSNGFSTVNTIGGSSGASCNLYMNGTTDYVEVFAFQKSGGEVGIQTVGFFDGHMVSSITEGEVKEKEAVVFRAKPDTTVLIPQATVTKINLNEAVIDTANSLIDGKFKPSVAGYYHFEGVVGTANNGNKVTTAYVFLNGGDTDDLRTFGTNVATAEAQGSKRSVTTGVVYLNGTTDYLELWGYVDGDGATRELSPPVTFLSAHLITGQSSGGGSGGGSYTPEPMVWEDKISERALDVVYTNTNDVPLYVQIYSNNTSPSYTKFYIDGKRYASMGADGNNNYESNLFVVPAGSKYQLQSFGSSDNLSVLEWHEARMPVAIGTGGKTVAFRGNLSADQTGLTSATWTKINLDTAPTDTDNALVDGKFMPSVAGYYQVNGAIAQLCTPTSTQTISTIYKNGVAYSSGTNCHTSLTSSVSTGSDVIYLNGTTDYVELYGYVKSTGTCAISSVKHATFLSAVLVSGGSASGDSIWTEEDGNTAQYKYSGSQEEGVNVFNELKGYGARYSVDTTMADGSRTNMGYVAINAVSGYDDANSSNSAIKFAVQNKGTVSEVMSIATNGNVTVGTSANPISLSGSGTGNSAITSFEGTVTYGNTYADGNVKIISGNQEALNITKDAEVTTTQDIEVNLLTVGRGSSNTANSTAFGYASLNKATGDQNTAIGYSTLTDNTTGKNNTALGSQALLKNITGSYNTGLGDSTLGSLTTGGANTMVGYQAGFTLVSGSNNICIGKGASPSSPSVSNEATIGDANVTVVRMGNGTPLTTTTYVQEQLAIKDKLIEKLSARLDELEKKVN